MRSSISNANLQAWIMLITFVTDVEDSVDGPFHLASHVCTCVVSQSTIHVSVDPEDTSYMKQID